MTRLRVFNLGLPKSGTTSLGVALKKSGLFVADWKIRDPNHNEISGRFVGELLYEGYYSNGDPLEKLGPFDVFSEVSVSSKGLNLWPQTDYALLRAIEYAHPEMKFVLTSRPASDVADSMRRWSNLGTRRLPKKSVPGLPEGYGGQSGELERWIDGHYSFCRRVFHGSPNFLEFDPGSPHAAKQLSDFLGIPIPWWGRANENTDRLIDDT
ncbi:hypothetical protein SAMN05421688_0335 [Poseidonocella pacifica]|uniref:Sulfotransferase family protein n=1 Tax=Poseidonocella pacifica TaxID=871651 RepID=A0A1I0V6V0_9RHOB|nr:sulfotransferase [Poseidonocella pacifica]SFA71813.1 hypothetical protein SAMN05421688_0335 [Poseidonocella pacifica]